MNAVSNADILKALLCLNQLPTTEKTIYLQLQLNNSHSLNPIPIKVKHSILKNDLQICLFIPDNSNPEIKNNVTCMSINKLKTYKTYEQKRLLLNSFDLFLCYSSVVEMMPRLLGKAFFKSKKQPVVIKSMQDITNILSSVFLFNTSDSVLCKVGLEQMTDLQVCENIQSVLNFLHSSKLNVIQVGIKHGKTTTLPIFISDEATETKNIKTATEDSTKTAIKTSTKDRVVKNKKRKKE